MGGAGRCGGRGVAPTYLPAHDGHLPACYLVDAFQLALALVDQTGDVLHGLVRCLDVAMIAAKREVGFNHMTGDGRKRTDKTLISERKLAV